MNNCLFISENMKSKNGGFIASKSNLSYLEKNYNCDLLHIKKSFRYVDRVLNKLIAVDFTTLKKIINLNINRYKIVWIDRSIHSFISLILLLKLKYNKSNTKIYTYFHNNEYKYIKNKDGIGFLSIRNFILEKLSCFLSDKLFFISPLEINQYRHNDKELLLPRLDMNLRLLSNYIDIKKNNKKEYHYLFIGTNIKSNVDGINRFIVEKLTSKERLCIISRDIDVNQIKMNSNVEYFKNVDDLMPFFCKSLAFVAPIYDDSGLKIKVIEALLYDMPIVTTPEVSDPFRKILSKETYENYFYSIVDDDKINFVRNKEQYDEIRDKFLLSIS